MDIQEELYRQAVDNACEWLADPKTIILDTETTSLNGYLVEIAAINVAGDVLINTLVNPQAKIDPRAAAVHGHTAESLADAPVFADIVEQLLAVISGKRVVIYNVGFDTQILFNEFVRWHSEMWGKYTRVTDIDDAQLNDIHRQSRQNLGRASYECAMLAYSDWCGDWNEYYGNNRWQRLPGGDHSAMGDCRATLKVLRKIAAAAEAKNGTEL